MSKRSRPLSRLTPSSCVLLACALLLVLLPLIGCAGESAAPAATPSTRGDADQDPIATEGFESGDTGTLSSGSEADAEDDEGKPEEDEGQ